MKKLAKKKSPIGGTAKPIDLVAERFGRTRATKLKVRIGTKEAEQQLKDFKDGTEQV